MYYIHCTVIAVNYTFSLPGCLGGNLNLRLKISIDMKL